MSVLLFKTEVTKLFIVLNETPFVNGATLVLRRSLSFPIPPLTFLKTANRCSPASNSGRCSSKFFTNNNDVSTDAKATLGCCPNKLVMASLTYFWTCLSPFINKPQTSLSKHFDLKSCVVSILAARGSSMLRKSFTNIAPVFKCFCGTCFGGPTAPETKITGRFFKSSLNRSTTVFPLSSLFSQFIILNSAGDDPSSYASAKTELIGIPLSSS
mmetsp:Transcript_23776/g.33360  ORF Transcript_23776/g.33360 Transcript_23776/m.33360 type:complete len:213 (-) Transcript_23776:280-918(-)